MLVKHLPSKEIGLLSKQVLEISNGGGTHSIHKNRKEDYILASNQYARYFISWFMTSLHS